MPSGVLDECENREMTGQQCIDSLAGDDTAIVEQCPDCYRAIYHGRGNLACFCDQAICVGECPAHPF